MTRQRFEYLFKLYRTDRLSQQDWEEFRAVIRTGDFDSLIKDEFILLAESDGIHKSWSLELESAMWKKILEGRPVSDESMEETTNPVFPESPRKENVRRVVVYSGIAASLIALGMIWWFRPITRAAKLEVSNIKTENNIIPGSNKAVLILPNGSQIVLDNSHSGQIAQQGNTAFHKSGGTLTVSFLNNSGIKKQTQPGPDLSEKMEEALIATPRGGQFELVLPDGSKVWLNSASSLRFPTVFKGKQRTVELTGEGYFEITKNAKMPFVVSVQQMKIAVLGTHFNVMSYADEKAINTTLLEGAVNVSSGTLMKRLEPGMQASLHRNEPQLTVAQADVQKTMAWKNGLFEFDNTDLPTIMRQLARWYDIEIIYEIKPDNTTFGGSISRSLNLTEVINLLEANGNNHFKIENKKVFVLP